MLIGDNYSKLAAVSTTTIYHAGKYVLQFGIKDTSSAFIDGILTR